MSTGVILLAAGSGRRFGRKKPKQFHLFRGEPLYLSSLRQFLKINSVSVVCLVMPRGRRMVRLPAQKKVRLVNGGRYRGESVRNGLLHMPADVSVVLVHDAARPLIDAPVIKRVEAAAKKHGVSLAAWPLSDTLKFSNHKEFVKKTIPRDRLWLAQTPQGFRRRIADKCLLRPTPSATDDVSLAEKKGYRVKLVMGSARNIKVTVPADLDQCRALPGRAR